MTSPFYCEECGEEMDEDCDFCEDCCSMEDEQEDDEE
jgi:hypothetical protein